ncbi:MAG: radical SAM protein [Gammaproteobacteria bacterium]|nr:radical SAM protein [Gammaproteobacteria bacterium]
MTYRIDSLKAPLLVSWQLTRDCDLACLHCCTDSAPGKRMADEFDAGEAIRFAEQLAHSEIPYVMLCGGEPLIVPHFFRLAETLGRAGIQLKIETNGQTFDDAIAERLARLPVRSVQISLDGATQEVYARQRPGASLEKAHAACRAVRRAGLPLEVTFAPTRFNIHQLEAVIAQARAFGAFRFNTGRLMRIGTAARQWQRLTPSAAQYRTFIATLQHQANPDGVEPIDLRYLPFTIVETLRENLADPPATMLVLPNGWVKVAAVLPLVCADLRRHTLADAWDLYRRAWRDDTTTRLLWSAIEDEARHSEANSWYCALRRACA